MVQGPSLIFDSSMQATSVLVEPQEDKARLVANSNDKLNEDFVFKITLVLSNFYSSKIN